MEFGLIKSKIEKKLSDSYSNNTFKTELQNFKKIVLQNESISKAFHIYNELNENKGYSDRFAEDFLDECVDLYNRLEVNERDFHSLEKWIRGVVCENYYKDIDNVLNKDSILIENRIKSKTVILENLKKQKEKKSFINIPMEKMVEVANKSFNDYISQLSESEINQVKKYVSLSQKELDDRYEIISEMVVEKLENLVESSDQETRSKIQDTISKIKSQEKDVLNLIKLKNLNETL